MIFYYIRQFLKPKYFTTFLLVVFLTQFVFIEGYTISYVKVGVMALCPIVLLLNGLKISKALILALVYFVYVLITAYFHPQTFRFSTIGYLGIYIMMYVTFYNFLHAGAFSLEYFTKFVKYMIFAYAVCLICQQICMLVGIHFMPLINLNNQHYLSLVKLPSLSLEPSHSARIMGVLMYAYLKCNEYLKGRKILLSEMFSKEHRKTTCLFLWAMLTMGSGTAFISMAILSLYFMRGFQFIFTIPIFVGVFFILSFFELSQFERARNVAIATSTGSTEQVVEADGSAAVRIKPLLNTLTIDLTKSENWFGNGCDAGMKGGLYGKERYIGCISDYGLIGYIITLLFVFSCSYHFFSLPTLMVYAGVGGGVGNIAYCWGMLMVFSCVRYFSNNHIARCEDEDTDISN